VDHWTTIKGSARMKLKEDELNEATWYAGEDQRIADRTKKNQTVTTWS